MENGNAQRREAEERKYCLFHQQKGHFLNESKAFNKESLEAKDEFMRKVGLCFRCLMQGLRSNECSAVVKCAKMAATPQFSTRRTLKQLEGSTVSFTVVCRNPHSIGVSCSKIVLVDVFNENQAQEPYHVYAVLDDQNNASMICPNIAHKIYFLLMCSGGKEERSWRISFRRCPTFYGRQNVNTNPACQVHQHPPGRERDYYTRNG